MSNVIKKVPIPLCGVMLGTAALGNLLQSYSEGIRYVCGVFAGIPVGTRTVETDHVPGSCQRGYEQSDHGKCIRNIPNGTDDLKHLCEAIYRTGSLLYLAVCYRTSCRADNLFYH